MSTLKGKKQSAEHIAKRAEGMRRAWRRPEYRAKLVGHEVSKETREKIGAANSKLMKGREIPTETREKMKQGLRKKWQENKNNSEFMTTRSKKISDALKGKYTGKESSNWKGGINQNERTDNKRKAWKETILVRDNFTCQVCFEYGVILHIDHIQPWADFPELRFDVANGRAVCRPCHYYITYKRKMPKGSRWAMSKTSVGILDLQ